MTQNIEMDINDPSTKPVRKNVHERIDQNIVTATEMDENRRYEKEYEYLCYMAQARDWISQIIGVEMKNNMEFKEKLRRGEILAKLAQSILNRPIRIFEHPNLVYRHTDNHNEFLNFLRDLKFNYVYFYGVLDAYNDVNIPSVIFCLHALSNHLQRLGYKKKIEKKEYFFTETELSGAKKDIENFAQLNFEKIGSKAEKKNIFSSLEEMRKIIADLVRLRLKEENSLRFANPRNSSSKPLADLLSPKPAANLLPPKPMTDFLRHKIKEKIEMHNSSAHGSVLKKTLRSFLRRNAFKEIFEGTASIFSIKEILKRQSIQIKYIIESKHNLIMERIAENMEIEDTINELFFVIELVLDNKRVHTGLHSFSLPIEFNKNFEKIFHYMRAEPKILLDILSKIDKNELEDFIPRYIVPLFNTSSSRDQFLILKLIDEDNSDFTSSFYSEENEKDEIHSLSFKVVVDLFRCSEEAKKICTALLVTRKVQISTVKDEYVKSLETIKEIVSETIERLRTVVFPAYVTYFFDERNEKTDTVHFYEEFVSPFITAPDAFLKKKNFNFDRNSLLTIDSVFKGIVRGEFSNEYYRPLFPWALEIKAQFEDIFSDIVQKTTAKINYGLFRITRPSIKFQFKELNNLLKTLKIVTTVSPDFDAQIKRTVPYSYIENDFVKLHLNPVIKNDTDKIVDDIIDIIRVSSGKDLEDILKRKATDEEEMKYKKLLNFRRIIKNKFLHDENIHEESNENEKYLNEDILGEDYDEGGQASSLSSEPGRKKYVDDRKCLLDVLKGKLAVKKVTPELVRKICEKIEESQVLISQKRSETKINNKTLLNLKQQKKFLKIRKQTVTEYYKSILESYFCKLGGNCTRRSVYGTYKYSIRKLLKNSILVKLQDYTEDDPVRFYFGCDIPGVLLVSVNVHNQVFEENKFLFETVLKKKESQSITIGSCVFNPKGLLRLVNDCYFE